MRLLATSFEAMTPIQHKYTCWNDWKQTYYNTDHPPDSSSKIGYIHKGILKFYSPLSFYSPGPETETGFPTLVETSFQSGAYRKNKQPGH